MPVYRIYVFAIHDNCDIFTQKMAAGMFINSVACHNFKEQDDDTANAFIDTSSSVEGPRRVERILVCGSS